jgi:uncharacterized membrane protein YfcA
MLIEFLILFISGSLAGLMAGLLGLGGATVLVPLYLYYFKIQNLIPPAHQYHMAIGCSLAVIFINSLFATYENYKAKHIDFNLMKRFLPGLILGIFTGTFISHLLGGQILTRLFAIFLTLTAIKVFYQKPTQTIKNISPILFHGLAFFVGILNTLFGIAGGIVIIPFFIFIGLNIKRAIGTSMALAIPISLIANLGLNLTSSYLLIDWTVVLATALASFIFIPIGSKLGKKTSSELLKKIFAIILLFIAMMMFMSF